MFTNWGAFICLGGRNGSIKNKKWRNLTQSDTGAVLFSFLEGEQQQFAITFKFLVNITGYEFEAAIMEALNTGNGKVPKDVRPSGVTTELILYQPPDQG